MTTTRVPRVTDSRRSPPAAEATASCGHPYVACQMTSGAQITAAMPARAMAILSAARSGAARQGGQRRLIHVTEREMVPATMKYSSILLEAVPPAHPRADRDEDGADHPRHSGTRSGPETGVCAAEPSAALLANAEQLRKEQEPVRDLGRAQPHRPRSTDLLAHSLGALGVQIQAAQAVLSDQRDIDRLRRPDSRRALRPRPAPRLPRLFTTRNGIVRSRRGESSKVNLIAGITSMRAKKSCGWTA